MHGVEHDLIFAFQAAQLGYLSEAELLDIGLRWSRESGVSLRDLVVERAGLKPEDVALLAQVAERLVARDGGDARTTVNRLVSGDRVFETLGGTLVPPPEAGPRAGEPISGGGPADGEADAAGRAGEGPEDGCISAGAEDDAVRPATHGSAGGQEGAWEVTREQAGRYALREELGRGGIGRVFVVFDRHARRRIALKELIADPTGAGAAMGVHREARFLREARVTAQLEHPGVVPVYEVGQRADGSLYYTMRLVRGRTLADSVRSCRTVAERLRLLPHYVQLCQAVAYAHSRGVIHRDLKTSNVMVGQYGETVVLDWGLAKVCGDPGGSRPEPVRDPSRLQDDLGNQTVDGRALGTPAYMSPEQAEGRLGAVDERSDVWSLGVVLYEILVGHPPFHGGSALEVMGRVLADPIPPPRRVNPEVPPELSSICEKALRRDPDRRYGSAQALADEVEAFRSGARVRAYDYSSLELLRRFVARNRALATVSALGLVALIAAAAVIFGAYRSAERARRSEQQARLRAERNLRDRVRAEDLARLTSRQLAWAYRASAEREVARRDLLGASVYAAAALLHHPANPWSPYRAPDRHAPARGVATPPASAGSGAGRVPPGRDLSPLLPLQRIFFDIRRLRRVRRLGQILLPGGRPAFVLAVDPEGRTAAVGGTGRGVTLLRLPTGAVLGRVSPSGSLVTAVAFDPTGRWLAAADKVGGLRVFDARTRRPVVSLSGHRDAVLGLAFSRNGRLLASVGQDRQVRLWEVPGGALRARLAGATDTLYAVALSASGILAAAGADRVLRLWHVGRGSGNRDAPLSVRPLAALPGRSGGVFGLCFTGDGRVGVSAGEDGGVRLWDGRSGRLMAVLRGHEKLVRSVACAPGGGWVASASFDQTVRVWSVEERRVVATLRGHGAPVDAVAFAGNRPELVSSGRDGVLRLWEVSARSPARLLAGHGDLVEALAPVPGGRYLVSGSYDRTVRIWPLHQKAPPRVLRAGTGAVLAVAVSPDGRWVAAGGRDGRIRLWRRNGTAPPRIFSGHRGDVNGLRFYGAAGALRLASAGSDRTVRLWAVPGGEALAELRGHSDEVYQVVPAPEGRALASCSFDGTVRIWRLPDGQTETVLSVRPGYGYRLAYAPDGAHLAVAVQRTERAAEVRIFDLRTRRAVRRLTGHRRLITGLAYSPDGRLLLTGSRDHTVRLWEPGPGRLVQVIEHSRDVSAVAFLPGGRQLAANDWKTVHIYPLQPPVWWEDPRRLLARAQQEAGLVLDAFALRPAGRAGAVVGGGP